MIRKSLLLGALLSLGACATPVSDEYQVSREVFPYFVQLRPLKIALGRFSEPEVYHLRCVIPTQRPEVPEGRTHAQYIKNALRDELRLARVYTEANPDVVISGDFERISVETSGITDSSWLIQLRLTSSNGTQMTLEERYKFDSGLGGGPESCVASANEYMFAVRNLLRKLVAAPQFRQLVGAPS